MSKKRLIVTILILSMVTFFAMPMAAFADDGIVNACEENVVTPGALTINKDVPNVTGSSVMFDFTVYDGNLMVATGSAAETESLTIPGLLPRTYTVVESPRIGYTTEDDMKNITVVSGQTASLTFVNILGEPEITIVKTVDPTVVNSKGDSVSYKFDVTNTGNVPLENVTLTDDILGLSIEIDDLPYTTTVAFDLDDLAASDWDGNLFNNTATASAFYNQIEYTDTDDASVRYNDPAIDEATISIDKTVSPATVRSRNANVEYSFVVENTGDFPLYNVTITDLDLDFSIQFDGILAVGDDFTTTRAFDLEDLGTGDISDWTGNTFTNTARVTAMYGEDSVVTPDEDTATVTYRSSSSVGGNTTVPIVDEETPAAPIVPPVTNPILTPNPVTVVPDVAVPGAPLPQTGGFDPLFLYGLGALIASGGLLISRRNNQNKL